MCVELSWFSLTTITSRGRVLWLKTPWTMEYDSPRLKRLVAASSTCRAGDGQRRKKTRPPNPSLPPSSWRCDSSTEPPASHRNCLSHALGYHVSSETRGIRVMGLSWGWNVFSVLRRKVLLGVGREGTQAPDGAWQLISFLCQKSSSLLRVLGSWGRKEA